MTAQGYQVIMCDPPWPVDGHYGGWGSREERRSRNGHASGLGYTTAVWADVWSLMDAAVFSRAAPHHAVFLWTLEQFLTDTERELAERGYQRVTRIVWDKECGLLAYRLLRAHEYLLWYCKPRLLPAAKDANCSHSTVIRGQRRQHSRKPSAAYAMVEALYPDARKLDAFSREFRPGWDGWGNERDHFTPLLAPLRQVQA